MQLLISVNLCCLDFDHEMSTELSCCAVFFLEKYAVAYIWELVLYQFWPWGVQFTLLSYTSARRIAEWDSHVFALFAVFLMKKWTGFPKRCFSPKRLFQIFFSIHTTPHFLSCKYLHLVCWRQFMSDPVFFRNNLYHCYLIQFFWLVAKITINLSK